MPKISIEIINIIFNNLTNLEELKLNLFSPDLLPFLHSLPQTAPGLKKLTLSLAFFQTNASVNWLINVIKKGQCKDLLVMVDPWKKNPIIPPALVKFFGHFSSFQIKFQSPEGVLLTLGQNFLKIELGEDLLNSGIDENEQSRKHLACFSQLLQNFRGMPIILDMKGINTSAKTLIGLSQAFPYLSELVVGCCDFDPRALKGFYHLKVLRFSSADFLNRFSYLPDLQDYPVDVVIDNLESGTINREDFIKKLVGIKDLLPNFQPLRCLTQEQKTEVTDREFLALIPKKCISNLNFTGMHQISSQAVLEILKTFPDNDRLHCIANCQRIEKEIGEEQFSVEDFILLIDRHFGRDLFKKTRFSHYRKQFTDQHIDKLLNAKKIPPATSLFLADMSLMGTATFLRLLREVNPMSLYMDNTPVLYSALKFGASHIQSKISLPFGVLREKEFLKPFLDNYLKNNTDKKVKSLIINFESSDLVHFDANMIAELTQNGLKIVFSSSEMQIDFNPKVFVITFKDCETNRMLSKESPSLTCLEQADKQSLTKYYCAIPS